MEIVEASGANSLLLEIGWGIATELSELVDALDVDSSVLDGFTGFARADIMEAHELVVSNNGKTAEQLPKDQQQQLIGLAFGFVPTRDRLDVLSKRRADALLECRAKARELLSDRDDFVSFDENRFSPARRVAGNILHGQRRYDRKSAWKRLEDLMETALIEAELRDDLIRLGLSAQLGSGSGLSSTARRRIGLARGLIKRPNLLILDSIAGSENENDTALRAAVRAAAPETTVIYAATEPEACEGADILVEIADNGMVTCTRKGSRAKQA